MLPTQTPILATTQMYKLYDFLLRKQLYFESVKNYRSQEFRKELPKIVKEIKVLFAGVKLDDMTKRELGKLVTAVRKAVMNFYDIWANQLLKDLEELNKADLSVTKIAVANSFSEDEFETEDEATAILKENKIALKEDESRDIPYAWIFGSKADKLFDYAMQQTVPAVGTTLEAYIASLPMLAAARAEQAVKSGIANNDSASDIADSIIGTSENNYKDGIFLKTNNNAEAISDTSFQHIDSIVTAGVLATVFAKYRWISVMDSRTSDICLYRNNRIYAFGKGPLPPAHTRCRSSISAQIAASETEDESFQSWLTKQPQDIQKHVLGKKFNLWASSNLSEADFPKFNQVTPLSISQFKSKLSSIVTR